MSEDWEIEPKGERSRPPTGKTAIGFGDGGGSVALLLSNPAESEAWRDFLGKTGYAVEVLDPESDEFWLIDRALKKAMTFFITDQTYSILHWQGIFNWQEIPTLLLEDRGELEPNWLFETFNLAGILVRGESGKPEHCELVRNPIFGGSS